MLEIKNLTKKYGSRNVLDNLSFSFPEKGLYLLLGENGSGKSTLLSILGGRDKDYEGRLIYNQCEINSKNIDTYASNAVSFLPQNNIVFEDETTLENALILSSKSKTKEAIRILDQLGLHDQINQKASSLSSGEKQRICIARELLEPKDVILCDEITANLDKESADIIYHCMLDLSKDHLVIFISHSTLPDYFTKESKEIHIQEGKLDAEENKADESETNDTQKKSTQIPTKINEKKSIIFLCLISILFCILIELKGSILSTFEQKTTYNEDKTVVLSIEDRSSDLRRNSFLNSSPIFLVNDEANAYEGIHYQVISQTWIRISKDPKKAGTYITGLYALSSEEDFSKNIKLLDGRYPKNENEIIVSDLCKSYSDSSTLQFSYKDYTIVGTYKSENRGDFEKRCQKAEDYDTTWGAQFFRLHYTFMQESLFTFSSEASNSLAVVLNNSVNRKKLPTDYCKSEIDLCPFLLVDQNGNDIISLFERIRNSFFFYVLLGAFASFLILFFVSFYYRNKRKYLLLRYLGISRNTLTKKNWLTFSISFLVSVVVGYLISFGIIQLANCILNLNLVSPIDFSFFIQNPFCPLMLLSYILFFVIFFWVLLEKVLVKKDLSKQIYEAKIA